MILHITPRERALLLLLASGTSTSELAVGFRTTESEMAAHLNMLFSKMGAVSAGPKPLTTRHVADC